MIGKPFSDRTALRIAAAGCQQSKQYRYYNVARNVLHHFSAFISLAESGYSSRF